jgi:hypothetical protein
MWIASPLDSPAIVPRRTRSPRCSTCKGKRDLLTLQRGDGFCRDCLDRSRVLDSDDLGGES